MGPLRLPGRAPWLTLSIVGIAGLVHAMPAVGAWLVYDRARVDAGEGWRLLTGSLVHLSTTHLLLDALAFGAGAAFVEARRGRGRLALLCLAASALVGIAVHRLAPELARYAGLSGVAFATIAAAALGLLAEPGARRVAGGGVLLLLVVKLAAEVSRPAPLLLDVGEGVVAAPVSHAAGVVAALLVVGATVAWRSGARLRQVRHS